MFESHFGFRAPPFQLNPDPTFYFGSKGHSNALAYLQYGVHQAEGFIVVTGEIGAGKTTLVRTLLEGLDSSHVKAAQIASTQLDATGLLQAMLTAFGVPQPAGPLSKASLISTLEAFFMTLAVKNKRALLVVDEAQNLSMDAIEELRMLSNFQLRKRALLQSFLVGQPELRAMLESHRLEQLRQRVIASCHLGPLDLDETRRYVEHRLTLVGWSGLPSFADEAVFPRIHGSTGGIPRRINLLCNRLLLSAFLENLDHISESHVLRIARELRSEVGETTVAMVSPKPLESVAMRPAVVPAPAPVQELALVAAARSLHRIVRSEVQLGRPVVLCVVDSPASYLKAALLAAELERSRPGFRAVVVVCRAAQHLGPMENYANVVDLPSLEIHLGASTGSAGKRCADVAMRFEAVIDEFQPALVVPLTCSDDAVTCSLLAVRRRVPVVRSDAGSPSSEVFSSWHLNARLLDRMADLICVPTVHSAYVLAQQGVAAQQVHVTGSLIHAGLQAAQQVDTLPQALLMHHGLTTDFVLVTARVGEGRMSAASLGKFLLMLARVRGDRPMLWLVCGETQSALRAQGLGTVLSRSGIALASIPVFSAQLSILQRCAFLVTDPVDELLEVALAVGTKILLLDPLGEAPQVPDHTVAWLTFASSDLGLPLPKLEMEHPEEGAAAAWVRTVSVWLDAGDSSRGVAHSHLGRSEQAGA